MNEEHTMKETLWDYGGILDQVQEQVEKIDWKDDDEIEVVVGGSSIYEIEGAGTKWAPVKGTRKYNKDAFIVIRRKSNVVSSLPMKNNEPESIND